MPAVRVRATSGWQDLTLQGAPGRSGGWQEIGYVEGIPDITVSGTSAVPTTILTLPALTFDGATTIELEFWARSVVPAAAANAYIAWAVWQDGVMLGVNAPFFQLPSGGGSSPAHLKTRIKPSAGSHTYSIRAWQVGGNGTMVGGQSPGCMMFFSAKIVQPQGMGPPLVTSLPSNPLDGQEVYYLADAANGMIWHLRYRAASSSAYKWEFVGGSPFNMQLDTSTILNTFPVVGSTGYGYATAAGGSRSAPLAGDYLIEGNALFDPNGTLTYILLAAFAGANVFGTRGQNQFASTAWYQGVACGPQFVANVTAGMAFGLAFTSGVPGTTKLFALKTTIYPVRVG